MAKGPPGDRPPRDADQDVQIGRLVPTQIGRLVPTQIGRLVPTQSGNSLHTARMPHQRLRSRLRRKFFQALWRVPGLRHPAVRSAGLGAWRAVKRAWRHQAERVGSERHSRPAVDDLDRKLAPYLPDGGVFVEAGANDGYRASNTYYLERFRGWGGALVEPIPDLAKSAARERPRSHVVNAALVARTYTSPTIEVRYGGAYSATAGTEDFDDPTIGESADVPSYVVEVPARTLSSVLDEAGISHVDFLSLDVQGYEEDVLRGLDFERHAPDLALIEIVNPAERQAIEAILGPNYSEIEQLTRYDYLYRKAS